MIDLIEIAGFLDPALCDELRAELQRAGGGPATLLGRSPATSVQPQIRKATRVTVSAETQERVTQLLRARKGALEEHFGLVLGDCEEPQFLRYETGDFFVAHQDGNTALIFDRSRFRRISVVIFLSAQSEAPSPGTYGGGSLTLHGAYSGPSLQVPVAPAPGTLVAFRAETTHEVMPVAHGERFTIVSWYPCPAAESDGR
ncbi:SM-20-related protein [Rhizobiales bacterium GAS191]|jgi:SM-20-related protein|nr:SM-20-related protein [Rhizobiales bacterium GAS113]SEC96859.1 SM-20-related protein [Rhizobiales bacterium GAS191]